jgi:hypothetical protein
MAPSERPPSTIASTVDVDGFFRELVGQAISQSGFEPSSAGASYVVSLLADSAKPNASPLNVMGDESSFTLLLAKALESHGAARFEKLRLLGDGVLYVSGFFSEHLERRGLAPYYVRGLGATAYGSAASMLRGVGASSTGPDVFSELSHNFERFVQLINVVSAELSARAVRDDVSLLEMYERWLKVQSDHLAELLIAQGVLPQRKTPGLH